MNEEIANELIKGLRNIFIDHLISIVLYGSVARGDETIESDINIAIFLKEELNTKEKDLLLDFVVDMDLEYERVFSIIDIEYDEFTKWEDILPFYQNIKLDGLILWRVA